MTIISRRDDAGRCMRVIVENGCQPPFTFADGPVLPPRVVLDLIAFDLADAEIRALRMAEIEPAHGGAGPHRETFGKLHPDALAVEQLKQRTLLGMVRLCRIAGRRPNAAILLCNQLIIGESFFGPVTPELLPHTLMPPFAKSFRHP